MGGVSAFWAEHFDLSFADREPTDATLQLRSSPIPRSDFSDTRDDESILSHCSIPCRFRLAHLLSAFIKTFAK